MGKKKDRSQGEDDGELEQIKRRIRSSEKFRDKERDEQGWTRFQDYYQGRYNLEKYQGGGSQLPVINIVFGHVRTEIAGLYFRNPYTVVNPRTADAIPKAHLLEADLNYRKNKMRVKQEIKKELKDTLTIGHGWVLVGYNADVGGVEDATEPDKDAEVSGLKQYIKKEEIFVTYLGWDEVVFDIASKDPPYDCRWIAYSFIKPLDDIKDNENYSNVAKLKSNVSLKDLKSAQKTDRGVPDQEYDQELVKLWVYFDLATRQIKVLSLDHNKFLREDPYQYPFDCPLSMLAFNKVNGKPYPLSDVYLTEPQILARIKLRAQMLNHMKRWNRQLSVEQGAMKPAEKEKLVQGADGAVVEVAAGKEPPKPIQYASLQSEIFAVDRMVQDDMDGVLGQTATERGQKDDNLSKTLGEAKLKQAGAALSNEERLDVLEDHIEEVDSKIIALIQKYQDVDTRVPAPGLKPQEAVQKFGIQTDQYDGQSVKFNKSHVQGDFDVSVKSGSSIKMNKQARDQARMQFLEMGVKSGLIMPNGPVAQSLARELMQDLELTSAEKAFDEEIQIVKQRQDMQMQMMLKEKEAELGKTAAETEKQKARAGADTKKADAEQLKASVEAMKARTDAIHKAAELSSLHAP